MKIGQWKGVITDWGVGKSASKGTPFVKLTLALDVEGTLENIDWLGYLTEKTKEKTIETLYKFGFNGSMEDLANGRDAGNVFSLPECSATINTELYDGQERFRVQWLNAPGEKHGIQTAEGSEAMKILAEFKADFLAAKPKTSKLDLKGV